MPNSGRPKGARNTKPSKRAINDYYRLLQAKADEGDVTAAAELIKIHHMTEQHRKETDHA